MASDEQRRRPAQGNPLTDAERAELRGLDRAIDSLLTHKAILNPDPYIATIPQDDGHGYVHQKPYHAQQFAQNTPFKRDEWENLQYATYQYAGMNHALYRQQVVHWEREIEAPPERPPGAPPRKLMSLSAYKEKKIGIPPSDTAAKDKAKSDAVKKNEEQAKVGSAEIVAAASDAEMVNPDAEMANPDAEMAKPDAEKIILPAERSQAESAQDSEQKKRKREDEHTKEATEVTQDAPAAKKARQDEPRASDNPEAIRQDEAVTNDKLDEATEQARQDESQINNKPGGVSQDQPQTNEKQGEAPQDQPQTNDKQGEASQDQPQTNDKPGEARQDELLATDKPEDSIKQAQPNEPHTPINDNDNDKSEEESEHSNLMPPKLSPLREVALPDRLSPTLPFKIEAVLWERKKASSLASKKDAKGNSLNKHLPPVAKKSDLQSAKDQWMGTLQRDAQQKIDAHQNASKTSKEVAKTSQLKANGLANKKTEAHQNNAKPSKGVAKSSQPKANGHDDKLATSKTDAKVAGKKRTREEEEEEELFGSAKRFKPAESTRSTPNLRKDVYTMSMQRLQSSNGTAETHTETSSTPQANGTDSKTSSKVAATKTESQRAWESQRYRFETLARSLKYAAQAHKGGPVEAELAAVKGLESIIAYLLAFVCHDKSFAASIPEQEPVLKDWMGLTPWYCVAKTLCLKIPQLSELASILGLALASRVLDLLVRQTKAPEQLTYKAYINMLKGTSAEMSSIQDSFPESWMKSVASKRAKLAPSSFLSVDYHLPVGAHTPPLQAALAARSMLSEWLERSKLEYRLQI